MGKIINYAVLTLGMWGLGCFAATAEPPNIIIFLADDLGYGDVGANGYAQDIATPHLDALAKHGVRFTSGYANHPYCSPSRAGLMSGMYQQRFGFEGNSGPEAYASPKFGVPRSIPLLSEKLQQAGYATGMTGKWHIGFREGLRPHERGFDFFYGFLSGARSFYPGQSPDSPLMRNGEVVRDEKEYLTDAFARESVDFIERSKEQPWFLYLAFNAVHVPLEATAAYESRFPDITDPNRKTLAGMLAALDDGIGRVMKKVQDLGEEENTLVFFYSDNGGIQPKNASLNGPLRGMKGSTFEGGIRVPFIAQWKGRIPAGQVYDQAVMGFDCHATALAAAGIPLAKDASLDSVNLLPFLMGTSKAAPHQTLFWRDRNQYAVRQGPWKLVKPARENPQLFNLDEDLAESRNLAAEKPEVLKQLSAAFTAWSGEMMKPQWIRQDARNAEPGGQLKANPAPRRNPPIPAQLAKRFKDSDKNGDGVLSRNEFPNPANFDRADRNRDGKISLDEIRARFQGSRGRELQRDAPPPKPLNLPAEKKPLFQLQQRLETPGGPLAVGVSDFDGDGWDDLVLPSAWKSGEFSIAWNRQGEEPFELQTLAMSDDPGDQRKHRLSKGIGLHDFDNDGKMDLYLGNGDRGGLSLARDGKTVRKSNPLRSSINSVQLNRGDGRFETRDLGIDSRGSNVRSVLFSDFDGDGHMDSYHSVSPYYGPGWGGSPHGNEIHPGTATWDAFGPDLIRETLPDPLFWQDAHHRAVKMCKAALVRDLDGDGKPDLVTGAYADIWGGSFRRLQTPEDAALDLDEDGIPDTSWPGGWSRGLFLLRNVSTPGSIRFENVSNQAVDRAYSEGTSYPQMHVYSIVAADIDHDADLDLLVTGPRNVSAHRSVEDATPTVRLLRNDSRPGKLAFADITAGSGFDFLNAEKVPGYPLRRGVPNLAAGVPIDVDRDGHMDFILVDRQDGNPASPLTPWVFHNDGKGHFERIPAEAHGLTGNLNDLSYGDFDRDGRVDLVFVNGDPKGKGYAAVYRNTGTDTNHWISLRITWPENRFGLESKVTLLRPGTREVLGYDEVRTDVCYRSKRSPTLHFGLGTNATVDVEVMTRDGRTQLFTGLASDRSHRLELVPPAKGSRPLP